MDFSMGLVSTILVLSIFLPFAYAAYQGKIVKSKMNNFFDREIIKSGYQLDLYEQWSNKYIGLDVKRSTLLFLYKSDNEVVKKEILIGAIKEIKVLSQRLRFRNDEKSNTYLSKVTLLILDEHNKEIAIDFFDSSQGFLEDYEIARAERWKKYILDHEVPLRPLKSAA